MRVRDVDGPGLAARAGETRRDQRRPAKRRPGLARLVSRRRHEAEDGSWGRWLSRAGECGERPNFHRRRSWAHGGSRDRLAPPAVAALTAVPGVPTLPAK